MSALAAPLLEELELFALYWLPGQEKGDWSVQRWCIRRDRSSLRTKPGEPAMSFPSIELARAAIEKARPGAHQRIRHREDDKAIVEIWL